MRDYNGIFVEIRALISEYWCFDANNDSLLLINVKFCDFLAKSGLKSFLWENLAWHGVVLIF